MSPFDVQVITATMNGRQHLFAECEKRVRAQVYPVQHIVVQDGEGHRDSGITAFNAGCVASTAPWLYCVADDEWLEPQCIAACMLLALQQEADFVVHYRQFPQGVQHCGQPPDQNNLTTGLFKRECLSIFSWADNFQPSGGDGIMGRRWIDGGAKMAVVPRILSRNLCA